MKWTLIKPRGLFCLRWWSLIRLIIYKGGMLSRNKNRFTGKQTLVSFWVELVGNFSFSLPTICLCYASADTHKHTLKHSILKQHPREYEARQTLKHFNLFTMRKKPGHSPRSFHNLAAEKVKFEDEQK